MKRFPKFTWAWVLLFFLITFYGEARGTLIYDNGAITKSNFSGGASIVKGPYVFDDFTLSTPAQITGVRFWIWKKKEYDVSQPYKWEIREDSNGWPAGHPNAPAPPILSGSIDQSNVNKTWAFEVSELSDVYENEFSFDNPLNLNAGTYWFSLSIDENIPESVYLWAFSSYPPPLGGFKFYWNQWGSFLNDLGFQLYGHYGHPVSEPATLILLLSGLLGAFAYGRKRPPSL